MSPDRVPVIVGVGQINDRPVDPAEGVDLLGLMEQALRHADENAGGAWLKKLDSLAVVAQISFPSLGDVAAPLAARLGATPRLAAQTPYPMGDGPIRLLNEAANRIAAGESEVAAVVGGEALRTAALRAAAAAGNQASDHNATRSVLHNRAPAHRARYGLVAPVDVYPLYENAGRAVYGQTLAEGQAESAAIWQGFSRVAAENAGAWMRKAVTAEEIATPSAGNRMIAFPYTKLMVANSSVNQGAGFVVTSLAAARARGIAEDRLIYVGRGAAAVEFADFLARDRYDRSVSMEVSLRRTLALNEVGIGDIDFVELYSCFPCVPKMARRALGWDVARPATVFGGLTFGGGPIGNYMSHAVVAMVERLRGGGRRGLLFGNGGFATSNHSVLLSRDPWPAGWLPEDFDYQAEADAARDPIPKLDEAYTGPGKIETYTVFYERGGEVRFGVIVGRAADGRRFLAKVPAVDDDTIAFLTGGASEPVGSAGTAVAADDGTAHWRIG